MIQPIAFIDLAAQRRRIAREIDAAIARVFDHGIFISGPEVAADDGVSVWAQYTVRILGGRRDKVAAKLKAADRRADGDLLPQAAAPADRLPPFPRG